MPDFSPTSPIYHHALDDWGLGRSTRVWMATGKYKAVQKIERGDVVMGITFRTEADYIGDSMESKAIRVRRPRLCARLVLGVRKTTARPWQLTFGTHEKLNETRRLVAGADTEICTDPVEARASNSKEIHRLTTAVENPRTSQRFLPREMFDPEASAREGRKVMTSIPNGGEPIGDMAAVIPFEAYGGQRGFFDTTSKRYNRYLFSQIREARPVAEEFPLYQLALHPDTDPDTGMPVRCNMIAQTPWPEKTRETQIQSDGWSDDFHNLDDKELKAKFDQYVQQHKSQQRKGTKKDYESKVQGSYWASKHDEGIQQELSKYGLNEWLNGGILIDVPVPLPLVEHLQSQSQTTTPRPARAA